MKTQSLKKAIICLTCVFMGAVPISCKKLIAIDEPINSLTSSEIFSTDATATSAMAGAYSVMINGYDGGNAVNGASSVFSAGFSTTLGALSADELYNYTTVSGNFVDVYNSNQLTAINAQLSPNLWTSAYNIIYKANSVIEGVAASRSGALHDNVKIQLTAEAKFIRAFSYFYLTNFFGDVPMVLTVDFNKTATLAAMPQQEVYKQIITDLIEAQAALRADYDKGMGERIIPNKWAATFLLARVYLYTGNYTAAAEQATAVINNNALFGLENDLKNVFSVTSREAVWQLKQATTDATIKNATPEGYFLLPSKLNGHAFPKYALTRQLLSAFETGDQRKAMWLGITDHAEDPSIPPATTYFPFKYITGSANAAAGQMPPQYYMVFRLAEAYLIRAEAEAGGAAGGAGTAIADLNIIRKRAALPGLSSTLNQQQLKAAVAKERQTELFAEWGHRWFDLKRTGQAHDVLSIIPGKQPWLGDYQLLYPIPRQELIADPALKQNPGY